MPRRGSGALTAGLLGGIMGVVACSEAPPGNPTVVMVTAVGDIHIELYADRAPRTVANFRRYVEQGLYDGASFYRTVRDDNQAQNNVRIAVIQGGLGLPDTPGALPPIVHEPTSDTGILHLDGTLSLARDKPGSGASEFFICVGPQPALDEGGLRHPDGAGFAAFGRVIRGMDVVKRIHVASTVPADPDQMQFTSGQMLEPVVPVTSVRMDASSPP